MKIKIMPYIVLLTTVIRFFKVNVFWAIFSLSALGVLIIDDLNNKKNTKYKQ